MTSAARYRSWLMAEGEAFAEALDGDPATAVPTCPGWSMADLAAHVGSYHRWAADLVRDASPEPRAPYALRADPDLAVWYRASLQTLIDAIDATDPETPMWTVTTVQTAGAWSRRQAHDLTIHRWDAENARGSAQPILPDRATDFIDELLGTALPYIVPFLGRRLPAVSLAVEATDRGFYRLVDGATGDLRLAREPAPADATLRGSASDLLLSLWRRPQQARLTGDPAVLAAWQDTVDS